MNLPGINRLLFCWRKEFQTQSQLETPRIIYSLPYLQLGFYGVRSSRLPIGMGVQMDPRKEMAFKLQRGGIHTGSVEYHGRRS